MEYSGEAEDGSWIEGAGVFTVSGTTIRGVGSKYTWYSDGSEETEENSTWGYQYENGKLTSGVQVWLK